ncbi:MAG: hypothetical protein C0401_07360 [Anaerolinea sp.]|nr:hypothetical protein [Anaerolinea sp.]
MNKKLTTDLMIVGLLLVTPIVAAQLPRVFDAISGLRAAFMFPILVIALIIAILWGRIVLLYLLAVVWVIPLVTAGVGGISLTAGTTAWELLLWLTVVLSLIMGDIPLLQFSSRTKESRTSSLHGIWIGLAIVTVFSVLAITRVRLPGVSMFRYAALDIPCLLILAKFLVRREKQLERWALWFLVGAIGLLVYQLILGGYEFVDGRLTVHMITPIDTDIVTLPNKTAILASSCAPLVLCLALGSRTRLLRLTSIATYATLLLVTVLTFSRAQIIAISIGSSLVFLLAWRTSRWSTVIMLTVLGVTATGAVIWVWPGIRQSLGTGGIAEITYRVTSFLSFFEGDPTLGGRISLIRTSFILLGEQPFGIGFGRITEITGYWEHNLFMAVMNGSGLLGLAGLLFFFAAYGIAAYKAIDHATGFMQWMCISALGSLITMAVNGLSNELIHPTYAASIMALAVGLAAINLAQKPGQMPAMVKENPKQ